MRRALHVAADLAVWAGLYVAGAAACLSQLSGLEGAAAPAARVLAIAFSFCTAMGVYLLDRVKLRDSWLDPADAAAHCRRFGFLARHARRVRALMAALLVIAAWLGAGLVPWGWLIPAAAAGGVLVYAARPRGARPRPKDIVVLKNAYVAAGITGFAAVVAVGAARPGGSLRDLWDAALVHRLPLVIAGVHLALRVFADAVLCDLDDEDADRRHGTGTLPTHLGRTRAWNIALGVRLALALALVPMTALPEPARLAWAGVTVVSSVALRAAAPARVRDWVDARLPMEAVAVAVVLEVWRAVGG